jgi:cytochrome c oxidase assembly protein Cox11
VKLLLSLMRTRKALAFRPTVASIKVHPGEMAQVVYEVVNNSLQDGRAGNTELRTAAGK